MMEQASIKIIAETFQEIADIVTPTMGAKGRLAVLNDEFGRPILTDDGVTVAKQCMHMDGFKQMIAKAMIEGASNTEKAAYDGTTLTLLMTNELYKAGLHAIKRGMHPQVAADMVVRDMEKVRTFIDSRKRKLKTTDLVHSLAYNVTKMQEVGNLVTEAYKIAGDQMNVTIEMDRRGTTNSVEHIEGMAIDAGYFSGDMRQLCNVGDKTEYDMAHIVLLAEGSMTQLGIRTFFNSIPKGNIGDPYIFVISKSFNPESVKLLLDTLVENQLYFQFIIINDAEPDELFLDMAARTGGQIQAASLGTSDYIYDYCGTAKVSIEVDKSILIGVGDAEQIQQRVDMYKKELDEHKYNTSMIRYNTIVRRLSNLTTGVVKIKIAVATVTEFMTIRLKIDDALGAVKCGLKNGFLAGCGEPLYKASYNVTGLNTYIKKALRKPTQTIMKNAGIKFSKRLFKTYYDYGYDVRTNKQVNLLEAGIIDSFDSIDNAIKNAASIAANYLRAFIVLK